MLILIHEHQQTPRQLSHMSNVLLSLDGSSLRCVYWLWEGSALELLQLHLWNQLHQDLHPSTHSFHSSTFLRSFAAAAPPPPSC